MVLQMSAAQRQVTETTSQHYTDREEKKNCWAHSMLEQERPNGSLRNERESKSKSLHTHTGKYKMCAHTGHMTFVLVTFASGDNEPACLFPTSLVLFSFFLPNKDSSDHGGVQTRRGWVEKKKKKERINGSILEEDKTLLGFNYFPL